jgi:cytochrome oxidase Cu insertion factor (SCO1/SenC/PrrC family)
LCAVACLAAGCGRGSARPGGSGSALAANPELDPGTSLGGRPAPGFRLVNQFGQAMSLRQFRGKVVLLAFIDSECTNVCPLTTATMTEAKALLGAAGRQVQLLAVNANPRAATVADVRAYSRDHGMLNRWDFLTGTPERLAAVWKAYDLAVQIQQGLIDHTPALLVIGPGGGEQRLYLSQLAYASIGQSAQVIAREAARLLPGRPPLTRTSPQAYIRGLPPASRTSLPALTPTRRPGIALGPGHPHLIVFFTTWLRQTSSLSHRLHALNTYARTARNHGLPQLTAIDETTTEPSLQAVRHYLHRVGSLRYPVAADTTGRVADGYGVRDQPWFDLVTASGRIAWHHDGWLSPAALAAAAARHR